jgi:DNA-directed RNA polymerase subunit K/omega
MFENWSVAYTVMGLVPNLIIVLIVVARLARQQRNLAFQVESVERELKLVDAALKELGEILARRNKDAEP